MIKMSTTKDLTSQMMELSDGRRLGYAEYGFKLKIPYLYS